MCGLCLLSVYSLQCVGCGGWCRQNVYNTVGKLSMTRRVHKHKYAILSTNLGVPGC